MTVESLGLDRAAQVMESLRRGSPLPERLPVDPEWYQGPSPLPVAGLAASILILSESGLLAVVARKSHYALSGLPGGKIDPEDSTVEAGLARETEEELGLFVDPAKMSLVFLAPCPSERGLPYLCAGYVYQDRYLDSTQLNPNPDEPPAQWIHPATFCQEPSPFHGWNIPALQAAKIL